jgi:transposase-like protein
MARKGQKQRKYTDEFIIKVVREKLETGKSVRYLARKYEIPIGTVSTWMYKYKHTKTTEREQRGRQKKDRNTDYKEKYEILKKYLEFLEEVEPGKK